MDIRPFGKGDAEAVDAFAALIAADHVPGLGHPVASRERLARTVGEARPGRRHRNWLAYEDGAAVGHVRLELSDGDNTHLADLHVQVHKGHRRRGLGRALYAFAEREIAAAGRTTIVAQTREPIPGGAAIDPGGPAFLTALGFAPGQRFSASLLDLSTVDEAGYAELEAEARARAAGYETLTWREGPGGGVPEDVVDDLAYLAYRLSKDMPLGDMDYEPEPPDPQQVRDRAADAARTGMNDLHAAVRHTATGKVVGWTFIRASGDDPAYAHQVVTVVDPDHRGHRLGLLVKLANTRHLRAFEPRVRYVNTMNALDNAHMLAVNTRLGYRPTHVNAAYQRRLS